MDKIKQPKPLKNVALNGVGNKKLAGTALEAKPGMASPMDINAKSRTIKLPLGNYKK